MVTGESNGGCASVALFTGQGESPKAAKPQDTGIAQSQTPPKEQPVRKEESTESQTDDDPTKNGPAEDSAKASSSNNYSPRARLRNSHEEPDTSKPTQVPSETNYAITTNSTNENGSTGYQSSSTEAPLKRLTETSQSDSRGESPVKSETKLQIGMQPIAPAPMGGVGGLANAPVSLAAAPPGNHQQTPVSAPGVGPALVSGGTKKSTSSLRRGKWTVEEEAYVARVIQDFNSGFLNAPAGTTLRSYLSEKLQCDPMRITKKFTGELAIGKRVFHPAVRSASNASAIDKAQAELEVLERRWRRRLEMQQRESAKKAAASAAASQAATSGRNHGFVAYGVPPRGHASGGENGVAQTATWLDRASHILKGSSPATFTQQQQKFSLTDEQVEALQSLPKREIEMQMKEVERLIHEGPIIQRTTADLGHSSEQSADVNEKPQKVPSMIVAHSNSSVCDGQQTPPEPADKRMRTEAEDGAEDAEALVGFLHAVRASAAAGSLSS